MKNTFSSEIGYRLMTREAAPEPEVQEALRALLLSDKPIEHIVRRIQMLLEKCLSTKPYTSHLMNRFLDMLLEENPTQHDITQLREALKQGRWPSVPLAPADVPTWNVSKASVASQPAEALASAIDGDMERVRLSHQAVFGAVLALVNALDRYTGDISRPTNDTALRIVNLATLFADRYDAAALSKLIIAVDAIGPHLPEDFAFFSKDALYKALVRRMKNETSHMDILTISKALSLTANAYVWKGGDYFPYGLGDSEPVRKILQDSSDAQTIVSRCIEQLLRCSDAFKRRHATEIMECASTFQCRGFEVDPSLVISLVPEYDYPKRQSSLRTMTRASYAFEEALSPQQRANVERMERELHRRFEERKGRLSVSASEGDAQEYLRNTYGHLPLRFNTFLYGFERDCLVEVPHDGYTHINFEIDGIRFHRFQTRKDDLMDYISKKKGVKVVRIEKSEWFGTKRESQQHTYDTIDEHLRFL